MTEGFKVKNADDLRDAMTIVTFKAPVDSFIDIRDGAWVILDAAHSKEYLRITGDECVRAYADPEARTALRDRVKSIVDARP